MNYEKKLKPMLEKWMSENTEPYPLVIQEYAITPNVYVTIRQHIFQIDNVKPADRKKSRIAKTSYEWLMDILAALKTNNQDINAVMRPKSIFK